ncbi:hypothetical protein [Mesorhizobium sp. M0244]|uniref:hypothetical protein n=1 Tax=unclassified Mesorhizobium TaxID=325217 RepID=UPI003335243F
MSDEGLDDGNPFFELSALIEKEKTKLGLPIGGVDLRVKSMDHRTGRGTRTVLRLPPRNQLEAFVRNEIVPQLRNQIRADEWPLRVAIDSDDAGLDITINPAKSPYSQGGFAAYDVPRIKDRNPLFNALKPKAVQLRGAEGVTGVVVCDGDCAALSECQHSQNQVSAETIAEDFLRQYSSIDFVLLLTIREAQQLWPRVDPADRRVHHILVVRPGLDAKDQLSALFTAMIGKLPKPVAMPVNGALRARERGYDLGHHGGYQMEGKKIRISSRELMEVLAGLRTLADNGAKNVEASRRQPSRPSPVQNVFLRNLQQGQRPTAINVIKTDEDDGDDWIEFEFDEPDPAISPFS